MPFVFHFQKTVAEARCPYCPFLKVQRSVVEKHIREVHQREVDREVRGTQDALLRMVNIMRPGIRCFSPRRLHRLLRPLKRHIRSKRIRQIVKEVVTDILAHALVAVEPETHTGRHFSLLGSRFKAWYK
jgi:hypothetical protein